MNTPSSYTAAHEQIINSFPSNFPRTIKSMALGVLFGIDGTYKFESPFFIRGKFSLGPAYRFENKITNNNIQELNKLEAFLETDFTIGYLYKNNQRFVINADYTSSIVKNDVLEITNRETQFGISYHYFYK